MLVRKVIHACKLHTASSVVKSFSFVSQSSIYFCHDLKDSIKSAVYMIKPIHTLFSGTSAGGGHQLYTTMIIDNHGSGYLGMARCFNVHGQLPVSKETVISQHRNISRKN